MSPLTSRVEPSGRVLIPAEVLENLGIAEGDELLVTEENGAIRLYTRASAIKEAQKYFAQFGDGTLWSEELIAMRREEAAREKS
jgi:AbrB family looped-hinge helix DNA binding protein